MSTARPSAKRTYGSNRSRPRILPLDYPSDRSSSLAAEENETTTKVIGMKRKRPFTEILSNVAPPKKKASSSKLASKDNKKPLTQLHFSIDRSIVRSCSLCGLSYTQGAIGDESLHKTHCARIRKGMEWGKEEERERLKYGSSAVEVDDDVHLKGREKGRIISVDATCGGKIGQRVSQSIITKTFDS